MNSVTSVSPSAAQAQKNIQEKGCRHEMPIKSVKGSLIKAGKQEDLTELMMGQTYEKRKVERDLLHDPPNPAKLINAA